jgi:GntR family transcriptional regulator
MLYRQVKRQLINDIQSGFAAPGVALPNEKDLASRFKVSVGTVRRAVDELVAEHVLLRQQGRGTFVGKLDRERFMFQFFKIVPRDGPSEFPDVRLHSFSKSRANQSEAESLGLHGNQWVFRIENVLYLKNQPVIHDKIIIAVSMFPGLDQASFSARNTTIYGHYQSAFGVTIVEADERVRAELATPESALLLNLDTLTPVLRIDRVAYTFDRKPAEFRTSYVDTRHFDYVLRMRETS